MAYFECVRSVSRPAGADLSSHQYKFVDINSSGNAVLVSSAGAKVAGVLFNDPVSGQAAEIAIEGVVKVQFGGTVAAGAAVTVAADGECVAAASTNIVHGIAVIGGGDGDIGSVLLSRNGYIVPTA